MKLVVASVLALRVAQEGTQWRQPTAGATDVPSFAEHGSDWAGTCRSRDLASPVDIDSPFVTSPPTADPFQYFYPEVGVLDISNNGRALEVHLTNAGGLYHPMAGGWHDLTMVRLRGGAEHTVQGHRAELEVQLVHERKETGSMIIASVLFDPPAGSAINKSQDVLVNYTAPADADASLFLEPLVASRPPRLEETTAANVSAGQFDLSSLIQGSFVEYAGEDTLPPCRKALWMVNPKPLTAGQGQVERLGQALRDLSAGFGNFRWVMPLNQRLFVVRAGLKEQSQVGDAPAHGMPFDDGPVYGPYRTREDTPTTFKGDQVAQDALTIEKYVSDYARDLDHRLQAGALARVAPLEPTAGPPMPPPEGAPPTGAMKEMKQLAAAARQLNSAITTTLTSPNVTLPAREITEKIAKSWTRQLLSGAAAQTAPEDPAPERMRAALRGLR